MSSKDWSHTTRDGLRLGNATTSLGFICLGAFLLVLFFLFSHSEEMGPIAQRILFAIICLASGALLLAIGVERLTERRRAEFKDGYLRVTQFGNMSAPVFSPRRIATTDRLRVVPVIPSGLETFRLPGSDLEFFIGSPEQFEGTEPGYWIVLEGGEVLKFPTAAEAQRIAAQLAAACGLEYEKPRLASAPEENVSLPAPPSSGLVAQVRSDGAAIIRIPLAPLAIPLILFQLFSALMWGFVAVLGLYRYAYQGLLTGWPQYAAVAALALLLLGCLYVGLKYGLKPFLGPTVLELSANRLRVAGPFGKTIDLSPGEHLHFEVLENQGCGANVLRLRTDRRKLDLVYGHDMATMRWLEEALLLRLACPSNADHPPKPIVHADHAGSTSQGR